MCWKRGSHSGGLCRSAERAGLLVADTDIARRAVRCARDPADEGAISLQVEMIIS